MKTHAATSLVMSVMQKTDVAIEPRVKREAEMLLYAWLLALIDYRDMQNMFRDFLEARQSPKYKYWAPSATIRKDWLGTAKWALMADHRGVMLKLVSYRLLLSGITGRDEALATMKRAGFGKPEADLYLRLLDHPVLWQRVHDIISRFKDPKLLKDLTLNFERLRSECQEDLIKSGLQKSALQQAGKRLRFVAKSQNIEIADLANDLVARATQYYYHSRPGKTRAHAINYARSAVSGGVSQQIRYWTSPDRARIVRAEDGETFIPLTINLSSRMMNLIEEGAIAEFGSAKMVSPVYMT